MSDTYLDTLRLEPQPSKAYDNADTPEAIAAVNRAEHAAARKRTRTPNGHTLPSDVWQFLAEDHRRAWARYVAFHRPRTRLITERIGGVTVSRPYVAKERETLVCASCGEPKPENKFPTLSGKPGVRGTTCRDCNRARIASARVGAST